MIPTEGLAPANAMSYSDVVQSKNILWQVAIAAQLDVRKATIQFYTQPNVGHIMMLEKPDEFCEIIKSIGAH